MKELLGDYRTRVGGLLCEDPELSSSTELLINRLLSMLLTFFLRINLHFFNFYRHICIRVFPDFFAIRPSLRQQKQQKTTMTANATIGPTMTQTSQPLV